MASPSRQGSKALFHFTALSSSTLRDATTTLLVSLYSLSLLTVTCLLAVFYFVHSFFLARIPIHVSLFVKAEREEPNTTYCEKGERGSSQEDMR